MLAFVLSRVVDEVLEVSERREVGGDGGCDGVGLGSTLGYGLGGGVLCGVVIWLAIGEFLFGIL